MHISVYLTALGVALASCALMLDAMVEPVWISTESTSFGLFQRCDKDPYTHGVVCRKFPTRWVDCTNGDGRFAGASLSSIQSGSGDDDDDDDDSATWDFCDSWISAGYAVQLSSVFSVCAILCALITASGGRHKRERGWSVLSGIMLVQSVFGVLAAALILHEFFSDSRFVAGHLDKSFILATTGTLITLAVAVSMLLAGYSGQFRDDNYLPIR